MRDRLIELLDNGYMKEAYDAVFSSFEDVLDMPKGKEYMADYLIANGVIVSPCKVGDKVYRISTRRGARIKYIEETTVCRIAIDNDGVWIFCKSNPISKTVFGKTVFLTKEEAEQALKEGGG